LSRLQAARLPLQRKPRLQSSSHRALLCSQTLQQMNCAVLTVRVTPHYSPLSLLG